MPIYDLRCKICGYEFTADMKMFDDNPTCPQCENGTDRIIKSVPRVHYKGQGFYSTDDGLKRDKYGKIKDVVPDRD